MDSERNISIIGAIKHEEENLGGTEYIKSGPRIFETQNKQVREHRIERIFKIARDTHKVLYKYNKFNLKCFFNFKENVIILEYFLSLARKVLTKGGPLEKYAYIA